MRADRIPEPRYKCPACGTQNPYRGICNRCPTSPPITGQTAIEELETR